MEMYKKYMIYSFEFFDQLQTGNKRGNAVFISVLDGASVENLDFTICSFFIDLFLKYYVGILGKLIIVDCSWYLKPPVNVLVALLPSRISKKICNMKHDDAINELGGPNKVADFLNGNHHFIMKFPSYPVTAKEYVKLNPMNEKAVEKLMCYIGK